jgi:hypothetical protein
MTSYRLDIQSDGTQETFNRITEIVGWIPQISNDTKHRDSRFVTWSYMVDQQDNEPYYDFINNFLDKLDIKFVELTRLGVTREDISFWLLYEYEQQCGLEFNPLQMKRLGDAGITHCIDCWQASKARKTR